MYSSGSEKNLIQATMWPKYWKLFLKPTKFKKSFQTSCFSVFEKCWHLVVKVTATGLEPTTT